MSQLVAPSQKPVRPTNLRYFVLASLLVITAINYIQRNAMGPAATTIERALSLENWQLDLILGAFFWSYTFLQVPSAWLAQRWGPRCALSLFAAGWSLTTLACGLAIGFADLYLIRLLLGALQAGIFPCATLILAVWYPPTQRGLASALLNSCMLLGGAAGTLLTGLALGPFGWRGVFVLYAIPGLLWAVWFYWWFRNRPQEHPAVNAQELALLAPAAPEPTTTTSATTPRPTVSWLVLLTSIPLLLLCTQQFFRAAANRLFDSRLPTYFEQERGQSVEQAAVLASWPQLFGIVGGIVGGVLSDWVLQRTGSRRLARNGVAVSSIAIGMGFYLVAYLLTDVQLAALFLSVGFFFFCFSSPCGYALTLDIGGRYLGVVFGLMNMAGNLGAALYVSTTMSLVNLGGWNLALGVWLSLHVFAILCWLFLDPSETIGEPSSSRSSP